MSMLHKRSYIVLVFAISVVLVAVASAAFPTNGNCSSHHSGSQPSAGYNYVEPALSFSGPEFISPNSTFNVKFLVSSLGRYEILNASATVSVSGEGELSSGEQAGKTLPNIPNTGGTSAANWTLKAKNLEGMILATVNLTFTSHYQHSSSSNNDYFHSLSSSYRISVKSVSIQLSSTQFVFTIGERSSTAFDIMAHSPIRNIAITESPSLNGLVEATPHSIASIAAGQNVTVSLSFNGNQSIVDNGRINIVWADVNGTLDSTFVTVKVSGRQDANQADIPILKWTGRITGIASIGLLVASASLGMIKIGKERRVRLHCAISWFLLFLSSYHGIVLLIGPYSSLMLATNMMMGYVSTIAMGIVSVNGLVEKWMTKVTSHTTWLWMHRFFIIVGIALGLAHGILMGTDFAFIRKLLGV